MTEKPDTFIKVKPGNRSSAIKQNDYISVFLDSLSCLSLILLLLFALLPFLPKRLPHFLQRRGQCEARSEKEKPKETRNRWSRCSRRAIPFTSQAMHLVGHLLTSCLLLHSLQGGNPLQDWLTVLLSFLLNFQGHQTRTTNSSITKCT